MKKPKRTEKKVEGWNGKQYFIRTVYLSEMGHEFIKMNGERHYIHKTDRGIYKAGYIGKVEYIEK